MDNYTNEIQFSRITSSEEYIKQSLKQDLKISLEQLTKQFGEQGLEFKDDGLISFAKKSIVGTFIRKTYGAMKKEDISASEREFRVKLEFVIAKWRDVVYAMDYEERLHHENEFISTLTTLFNKGMNFFFISKTGRPYTQSITKTNQSSVASGAYFPEKTGPYFTYTLVYDKNHILNKFASFFLNKSQMIQIELKKEITQEDKAKFLASAHSKISNYAACLQGRSPVARSYSKEVFSDKSEQVAMTPDFIQTVMIVHRTMVKEGTYFSPLTILAIVKKLSKMVNHKFNPKEVFYFTDEQRAISWSTNQDYTFDNQNQFGIKFSSIGVESTKDRSFELDENKLFTFAQELQMQINSDKSSYDSMVKSRNDQSQKSKKENIQNQKNDKSNQQVRKLYVASTDAQRKKYTNTLKYFKELQENGLLVDNLQGPELLDVEIRFDVEKKDIPDCDGYALGKVFDLEPNSLVPSKVGLVEVLGKIVPDLVQYQGDYYIFENSGWNKFIKPDFSEYGQTQEQKDFEVVNDKFPILQTQKETITDLQMQLSNVQLDQTTETISLQDDQDTISKATNQDDAGGQNVNKDEEQKESSSQKKKRKAQEKKDREQEIGIQRPSVKRR